MKRDAEKLKARELRELARREKQLGARSNKYYLVYLFMILALIYITDEIASTISIQFQTNIVTEFFVQNMGMEYGEGLSLFSGLGFITYPVTLLIVLYRPLADRFGRKPFLIVNTLTMALGLFIVYLSSNIYVYMIGSTLMGFMVSHDMQCVYILECSSEKTRARNYAMVKAVAILGTIIPPMVIISVISFFYNAFRTNVVVNAVLSGMQAGVAAVICDVVITMATTNVKQNKWLSAAVMPVVFVLTYFLDVNVVYIILGCIGIGIVWFVVQHVHKK